MHYLDSASTTAVAPAVADIVNTALREQWANPSSLYTAGQQAEAAMDTARAVLAGAIGCTAKEIVFTSGGTEANNITILGAARVRRSWGDGLVTTGYEHPSVLKPLRFLAEREGFRLIVIDPGPDGRVDLSRLVAAVDKKTALVSAMQVNNETGATLDVAMLAAAVKAKNPRCFVHVDGVQGFCKQAMQLGQTKIDSYATSGHKLHAPKGVGALYLHTGSNFVPPMHGGGQEHGIRPGTENMAYIAGYAKAVELERSRQQAGLAAVIALRQQLLEGLKTMPGVQVHSPPDGWPGIVFFSIPEGYRSQTMLAYLDQRHSVLVSSGSACDKGAPSHTLTAMGLPKARIDAAIRASFTQDNTSEDIGALLAGLREGIATLAHG